MLSGRLYQILDLVHPSVRGGTEPENDAIVFIRAITVMLLQVEGLQRLIPAEDPLSVFPRAFDRSGCSGHFLRNGGVSFV